MVVAGPGSGKTFVITNRILYLIEHLGIIPESILVITFSNSAAKEMKDRFYRLCDNKSYLVNFGTFHGIFYSILRSSYHYDKSNILIPSEQRDYIKLAMANIKTDIPMDYISMETIISDISAYRNQYKIKSDHTILRGDINTNPKFYDNKNTVYRSTNKGIVRIDSKDNKNSNRNTNSKSLEYDFEPSLLGLDDFMKVFHAYQNIKQENRKIDFDDMVSQCLTLLCTNENILVRLRDKYRYIMIDEYQDINNEQFKVIEMLSKPQNNLFVVGDDDQSIYGFRGANPNIMKDFERYYSGSQRILLDKNYRSSSQIVNFASAIIRDNTVRFDKSIFSARGNIAPVKLMGYASKEEEYRYIDNLIKASDRRSYNDIAILYRTNQGAAYMAERLSKQRIPYSFREKPISIYSNHIAQDILSYLSMSHGKPRRMDYVRIMNKPLRYLSGMAVSSEILDYDELFKYYSDKSYVCNNIYKFIKDIQALSRYDMYAGINYIRKSIGYDEYIKKETIRRNIPTSEWMDIADELQKRSRGYVTYEEWLDDIRRYEIDLDDAYNNSIKSREGIRLMTFHGSKGLEFKRVIIPECNDGNIPYKKSIKSDDIDEERRMFYVAMTRAKDELIITYVKGDDNKKYVVSRFIRKMIG